MRKIFFIALLSLLFISSFTQQDKLLQVHLIPHTHNDLGWLFSVASYYLGTNPRGCVDCILNNVTAALAKNPARTFSYVEMGYFRIWWANQTTQVKQQIQELNQKGHFEFLNSGVVMNDEGAAYYDDIIEQMSKGLKFVKDTFNYTVQTGWHIDPFGHSAAQANIFSQMGFNSWFFERIDYEDFVNRIHQKNLETLWRPHTFSDMNYILAHVNYMSYYLAPMNWCIDITCFPSNTPFDSMQLMFKYASWIRNQSDFYISNQVLHHIGGDFEWSSNAERHFQGLEFIVAFFHAHSEFGIVPEFSTPSNYTKAVYTEFLAGRTKPLTTKEDDFMPYVDVPHAFWTGYYTSRSAFKQQIRAAGQRLQTVRKIISKMLLEKPYYFNYTFNDLAANLDQFEEVNGILQHHDAVSGTAKQSVTQNYINMLLCATNDINEVLAAAVRIYSQETYGEDLMHKECSMSQPTHESTVIYDLLNNAQDIYLAIYNPSTNTKRLIQVKVPRLTLKVLDGNGAEVDADIMCDDYSQLVYCNLYFYADVPTNTFAPYKITLGDIIHNNIINAQDLTTDMTFAVTSNSSFKVSQNLADFVNIEGANQYPWSLGYNYYESYYKDNEQASGAYIFRPTQNKSTSYNKIASGRYFDGKVLLQVQMKGSTVVTSLKLRKTPSYDRLVVQVDTLTLPVDISDGIGKEITINFKTSIIDNKGVFYTDSNGLEMQQRKLNYRETYNVDLTEPVAGNYFPIYTAVYIENSNKIAMTVMNDRTQGGSSLNTGEIELMIQRRILHDDNRGVDQALNETDSKGVGVEVQMTHYLFFSNQGGSVSTRRQIQYDLDTPDLVFAGSSSINLTPKPKEQPPKTAQALPPLVKFYIKPYNDTNYLVRLHSLDENKNVNVQLFNSNNQPVVLSHLIGDLYQNEKIVSIQEMTIGSNEGLQDMLNAKYRWDGDFFPVVPENDLSNIVLQPLQMRVFNIVLQETGEKREVLTTSSKGLGCNCNCIFSVGPGATEQEEDYHCNGHKKAGDDGISTDWRTHRKSKNQTQESTTPFDFLEEISN